MMFKIGNKLYKEEEDGQLKEYNAFFNRFVPANISHNDYIKADKKMMKDDFMQEYYYIDQNGPDRFGNYHKIYKALYVDDYVDRFNKMFGNMFSTEEEAIEKYKEIYMGVASDK